jgi:hypothetical protein
MVAATGRSNEARRDARLWLKADNVTAPADAQERSSLALPVRRW